MVHSIEGVVDLQPVTNVLDEEREFQRPPEEETEYHEELYVEGGNRKWEEERLSSPPPSLKLRSASPKSPLVISDSLMPVRPLSTTRYLHLLLTILTRS